MHWDSPLVRLKQKNEKETPAFGMALADLAILLRWFGVLKAPDVKKIAWLPVGVNYNKPARGSVSLI